MSHFVSCITHVHQTDSFDSSEMLPNCKKICQHLCRMVFIGQTVPHRNSCILRQLFHNLLTIATVLNTVKHSSEHTRSILDAFLLSDLRSAWSKICSSHSHIVSRCLERAPCSCTCFFKNKRHIHTAIMINGNSFFLLLLQFRRQIHKI